MARGALGRLLSTVHVSVRAHCLSLARVGFLIELLSVGRRPRCDSRFDRTGSWCNFREYGFTRGAGGPFVSRSQGTRAARCGAAPRGSNLAALGDLGDNVPRVLTSDGVYQIGSVARRRITCGSL